MFPDFLPADTALLSEAASIALAQSIQRQPIQTSLASGAIATTYVHQGTGHPPILLLHGYNSSVLEFRRLQPRLAEHCSTWAIDLLGFGFTDRPPKIPFTPAAIKTHLYYTWKALIGEPVILIGASMGGLWRSILPSPIPRLSNIWC